MKAVFARREFLKRATRDLGFLGAGSLVFDGVLSNIFSRAVAQTLGQTINPSGYYIHFTMPGGPPRWYFDLPLTPDGKTAANFVQGGFGTHIEKVGAEYQSTYQVDKHVIGSKTIYLPPVWKFALAKQKFTDILPHTVFIRGMDMEINNHILSNSRQVAPIIGSYSLSGVVSDEAERPMPGVVDPSSPAAQAFRSKKGFGTSVLTYTENANVNPIVSLLAPFKDYMSGRAAHSPQANLLTGQAFIEFEEMAKARGITSTALPEAYDNAMELIEKNIFALSTQWAPTVAKYRAIVKEAMQPAKGTLPGVYDKAVPGANLPQFNFERTANDKIMLSDIRNMVTANTNSPRMAENFAIAELLLDNVTSNMVLTMQGPSGWDNGKGTIGITHDQHYIGSVVSTMTTTLFYRAFLGCLTEFTANLKARNLFDRTVMHISSEFNRTPHATGRGADHGFMGSNATLISGMIKKVGVVGNIQKASYNTTYTGTFGVAKPYVLDGFNRPIQVNDVARTISSMLGVADIVTNGRSLLAPSGKEWILRKAEAKNV
jgi:hypothetical protein